jgi:hypothetical protein
MKTIQTTFQTILLTVSFLALSAIAHKLLTVNYDKENLIAIIVFTIPVLLSFVLSATLLFKK